MDIINLLKKFRSIEPDGDFTKKSRVLILNEKRTGVSIFWRVFLKNIEIGTTLALAGLLIFMILGGFSAWRIFSPLQISNLDPVGLHAEAQAIDIQIQLTNLSYNEVAIGTQSSESTKAAVENGQPKKTAKDRATAGGIPSEGNSPASASSSALSIDEALQTLSQ